MAKKDPIIMLRRQQALDVPEVIKKDDEMKKVEFHFDDYREMLQNVQEGSIIFYNKPAVNSSVSLKLETCYETENGLLVYMSSRIRKTEENDFDSLLIDLMDRKEFSLIKGNIKLK